LRGYRKLAHLAGALVAKGGFLFLASCSHNADLPAFAEAIRRGIVDTGRQARILRTSGPNADHPVHPALPESAYLKSTDFPAGLNRDAGPQDRILRSLGAAWRPGPTLLPGERCDTPSIVARAEGIYMWDTDGRRYIDGFLWPMCRQSAEEAPYSVPPIGIHM